MMIPYGKQQITQDDIDSVVKVLQSDFLTQGPQVPLFESKLRQVTEASYAVAVNSATSALHLACLALDVGPGDIVWTSPITFVASANCALYCGASVDFVDIDIDTVNISVTALEEKLAEASKLGRLPKVIIVVHMAGQSCDMANIYRLALNYGIKIVEDASHAIGAKYQGKPVGCCQFSDISIFSFHPVKIITTAEGGAALTNNSELAERLALYRSHGITRNTDVMTEASHGDWYYQQLALGLNYRMTELQAALGNSQITRLTHFVAQRNKIAGRYNDSLSGMALTTPRVNTECYSAFHLYIIQLQGEAGDALVKERKRVFDAMREKQIGVHVHYIPVHLQPYYQGLGFKSGDFPNAEDYYRRALSIPIFHDMTEEMQYRVVMSLKDVFL